jgi:outer membrane protein TolC
LSTLLMVFLAAQTAAAQGLASIAATTRPPGIGVGPFLGGVPSGPPTQETLTLTIADVITRALEHNLGVLISEQGVNRARGTRLSALSALLPNVNGRVAESRQKVNLEAFGFPLPAGVPAVVGPFNVFDARVSVSQSVLDLAALNTSRAERHNLAAAEYSYRSARDLVVLVAANAYLQTLAGAARAESARAQLQTAEALFQQAGDLKQGGLVAGIDVLRAQVEMNAQRQRTTSVENDAEKAKLQLARIIGLPVGQAFVLSQDLPPVPTPDLTLEAALERAYSNRPDYQAALERVRAAEADRRAIVGEGLPSVRVLGDYGTIGQTVGGAHATFSLVGALSVPVFQGGRTQARLAQADADLRDRRAEAEDLRAGIYYEVRAAFLDLEATRQQLEVATTGRDLAAQQLVQARDRFAAGVSANIEVVQAQQAVAVASEQYISARYGYDVAKALLARDLGVAEEAVRQYLGGIRP